MGAMRLFSHQDTKLINGFSHKDTKLI